jgi:large-conductance mechanosensitive channel
MLGGSMSLDPGSLFLSILISVVGLGFVIYGKRQRRAPQLVVGVVLMGYGYFVSSVIWMLVIAAAVLVALWSVIRLGW